MVGPHVFHFTVNRIEGGVGWHPTITILTSKVSITPIGSLCWNL